MKSQMELRMECLRMAASLGIAKVVEAKNIVPTAMEFFRFVDDDPNDEADTSRLGERFGHG